MMEDQPYDALTETVRRALLFVGLPFDGLEGYEEVSDGELEAVAAGSRSVNAELGHVVANALGCLAMDIRGYEEAVSEALNLAEQE